MMILLASAGIASYTILVGAERSGTGEGRVYTITYLATDHFVNTSLASVTVTVPNDIGK
jgi:hypothetical protein